MKTNRELEHLFYTDRLREQGMFNLKRRGLWGDFVAAFQYLQGAYEQEGHQLFTVGYSDRRRGSSFKLKEGEI